ncbi:organic cation transporter protein-like [Anticarsia gemmatalis]|uniref:organic cation transporter protein-like n=1 Tax=Anticarsia gemmatalis TaxID=129554 RepID=UPI003F759F35
MDVKTEEQRDVKRKIDLDTILVEEIGQFGKFQLRTYVLAVIVAIFVAWGSTEYVFTTARISTRCVIPECDGDQPEWSPYWLPNALPLASNQISLDNCQRFGNVSVLPRLVDSDTCPSSLFDRSRRLPCDEYVYENTNTVVYDFELACMEWARTLIGTIRTLGAVVALPVTGYISDRWGRRVALSITAFNSGWLGVLRYWAGTYIGFTVSEFIEAVVGSGCYTSAYILMMEFMGPKYRVAAGASMMTFFSVGQILMALIAWALPYWKHLTLALYIPQLFTISYFWLISESARWYMSKGRFEESEALLKKAARVNGRQLSDKSLEALRQNAIEEAKRRALESETASQEWLVMTVFRHKRVLLRCIVAPIWWITSTFISYGLTVNAVNLSGNMYINYMLVASAEIPGQWVAVYLLRKIGRKPVLILSFWSCAACQIAYVFIPEGYHEISLTVYLVAKFSIAMEVVAVYIYTAELYPTVRRQSLFAFTSMIGRVGSMLAPLTPAFGEQWFEELPFVLFGSMALLAGALIFLTPETRGTKLPDTFEEANNIGRNVDKTEK